MMRTRFVFWAVIIAVAGSGNAQTSVESDLAPVNGGLIEYVVAGPEDGAPLWTFSRARIEAVGTPTLVVWGAESLFRDHSTALADTLPDAEGREIAETDHSLVTQEPAEIAEVMAEFIGRHPM